MSETELYQIKDINDNEDDKIEQTIHKKDIQAINISQDSDTIQNQLSTEYQNSSADKDKIHDSPSKEEEDEEQHNNHINNKETTTTITEDFPKVLLTQQEENECLNSDLTQQKSQQLDEQESLQKEDEEQQLDKNHDDEDIENNLIEIQLNENNSSNEEQQEEQEQVDENNNEQNEIDEQNIEDENEIDNNSNSDSQDNTVVELPAKKEEKTIEQILKESREQDERVSQLIKQTQLTIQNTLDSTDRTLKSVAQTMKEIGETNKKFDQFNNTYQKTMSAFGNKLAESIQESNLDYQDSFIPQITDIEDVVQSLKYKNDAVFVLGRSILDLEKNNLQNEEYFNKNNDEYWKVYGIVKESMQLKGASIVDNSLVSIANSLQDSIVNSTFITLSIADGLRQAISQNLKINNDKLDNNISDMIQKSNDKFEDNDGQEDEEEQKVNKIYSDDSDEEEMILDKKEMNQQKKNKKQQYHQEDEEQKACFMEGGNEEKFKEQQDFDIFSGKYNYFQINGNLNFIRCLNEQCENKNKPLYLQSYGPIYDKPICNLCQSQMRPHIKFIEEQNDEATYNIDWVKAKLNSMDCLILVGLDEQERQEPFYQELIQKSIEHGLLIIEISMMPALEIGYIKQLIGYPEELITYLRDQFLYG